MLKLNLDEVGSQHEDLQLTIQALGWLKERTLLALAGRYSPDSHLVADGASHFYPDLPEPDELEVN